MGEAQPMHLGKSLLQMVDAAHLAGEADLPYCRQRIRHRLIQVAGGYRDHRRQIGGRFIQRQSADDIQIGVALADLQPAALFQHRQQHGSAIVVKAVAGAKRLCSGCWGD